MKRCNVCEQEKTKSCFCNDKYSKDGLNHTCRECANKQVKTWRENNIEHRQAYDKKHKGEYYRKNREKVLKAKKEYHVEHREEDNLRVREWGMKNRLRIKTERNEMIIRLKTNGCAICGYNKYDGALEFHHTNPEDKLFSLQKNAMAFSDSKIADEVNKCILLCANCHREIHKC